MNTSPHSVFLAVLLLTGPIDGAEPVDCHGIDIESLCDDLMTMEREEAAARTPRRIWISEERARFRLKIAPRRVNAIEADRARPGTLLPGRPTGPEQAP